MNVTDSEKISELTGRVNALEGLVMMFAGIVLANTGNDKDGTKTKAILDVVYQNVVNKAESSGMALKETQKASSELLSEIFTNSPLLKSGKHIEN